MRLAQSGTTLLLAATLAGCTSNTPASRQTTPATTSAQTASPAAAASPSASISPAASVSPAASASPGTMTFSLDSVNHTVGATAGGSSDSTRRPNFSAKGAETASGPYTEVNVAVTNRAGTFSTANSPTTTAPEGGAEITVTIDTSPQLRCVAAFGPTGQGTVTVIATTTATAQGTFEATLSCSKVDGTGTAAGTKQLSGSFNVTHAGV